MSTIKQSEKTGWVLDNSYSRLPDIFYGKTTPTPVRAPELVLFNDALAGNLGLDAQELRANVDVLAGNKLPEGSIPIAQAYAGHQFGYFTMLGDGRALLLGEQPGLQGDLYDIQLKGSGRTPYSRSGDGRAALGPMLREYIISEAMHALGVPTTRSLAVVLTGEIVRREKAMPGAILTRVASSHIRVGTFQYAARYCSKDDLRALADYTLQRHFPGFEEQDNRYLYLLGQVVDRQAKLIAKWQLIGFIHGVMNTDNMTVSGETIDYGPCAFMDTYHPETAFSSIDLHGRYAYGNQPDIGGWNLTRFAETLLPLLDDNRETAIGLAQIELDNYKKAFRESWLSGMRSKLGLFNAEDEDEELFATLLYLMSNYRADYTNTFLALTFDRFEGDKLFGSLDFTDWLNRWKERLTRQDADQDAVSKLMLQSNPAIIPRNHRVEEALEAAGNGDYSVMRKLLETLMNPYTHTSEQAIYNTPPEPSSCSYKTFCGT